ncbi:MAG: MJ0042-type zinc finger domain-containing protein [Pseudomonadota bacterium]
MNSDQTVLECKNCGTCYETSAALPPEGRKVRCAKCSHIWHAMPQEDGLEPEDSEPESEIASEIEPEVDDTDSLDEGTDSDVEVIDDNIDIIPPQKPIVSEELEFRGDEPDATEDDFEDDVQITYDEEEEIELENWQEGEVETEGGETELVEAFAELEEPSVTQEPPEETQEDEVEDIDDGFTQEEPSSGEDLSLKKENPSLDRAENPVELMDDDPGEIPWAKQDPTQSLPPEPHKINAIKANLAKLATGWAGLGLSVVVILSAFYIFSIGIVKALPGAVHIYNLVGVDVNVRSLEFKSINYTSSTKQGQPSLKVSGTIVNVSDDNIKIPTVVFVFVDDDGNELYHMARRVDSKRLPGQRRLNFSFHFHMPPVEAKKLQVRFAKKPFS